MIHKRYERYKDSGIEWIGEIPEHWGILKLKLLLNSLISGGTPDSNDESNWTENDDGIPWVSIGDMFQRNEIVSTKAKITLKGLKEKNLSILPEGTLLYSIFATLGRVCELKISATTNQAILGLIPNSKISQAYLKWFLTSLEQYVQEYASVNTQNNLNAYKVKNLYTTKPPITEQNIISNYLDHKTSEIDSLIAEKEELITKLEEYKQSIITEAVTKGLNPDVKTKDSGIEWIGEIPEHWDIKKVKHITSYIGSGKTPRGGSEVYAEHGVLFLRSQNIYPDGLRLKEKTYIDKIMDHEMKNTRVKRQDVLLNITGASIGRASIVPDDFPKANVNQHVCILRPFKMKVVPSLLLIIVTAKYLQSQIFMHQSGSSREGLNFERVANLRIALPPISEQEDICEYLMGNISDVNNLIKDIYANIVNLKSYRQSLIYEAVTGKIDVRDFQPERSEQLA